MMVDRGEDVNAGVIVLLVEDTHPGKMAFKELVEKGISSDVEIVHARDENDVDVSPGKVGEVIARGDNMMKGYWELPQATAETIRGGYVRTGDLATIDEEGYIFLVGRKKEIITASE